MKHVRIFLLSAVMLLAITAKADNNYPFSKDYSVSIHGTSNLHSWDETVGIVTGGAIVGWNADGSCDIVGIVIKMDVHSIKSDMGSVMNNNTYKALKAGVYPEITFTLTSQVKSVPVQSGTATVLTKGNLTIAGVTKPVEMQVKVSMEGGKLTFAGSQIVKMTDYGIAPPTALFGTLKTGDDITIVFKTSVQ